MVINRTPENRSITESYDDLDAINDFILTYEEDNTPHSTSKDTCGKDDSISLINPCVEISESRGPYVRTYAPSSKSENISPDESSIVTVKMVLDSESTRKTDSSESMPINTSIEKFNLLEGQPGILSDSGKSSEGYTHTSSVNTKLAYNNMVIRKNNSGNKFIITRAEKVIECDVSRMNHRKSKKPAVKTTVYNIGRVSAESLSSSYRKTTYDVKNVFGDRPPICSDITQENPPSKIAEVLEVIKIDRSDEEDVQHRYFVGRTPTSVHILEAREYADLKYKDLYDAIQKKSKTGIMTNNYVKLIKNRLVCFKSKHIKYNDLGSGLLYFDDPYNVSHCYPEKYAVDLRDSRLYVVTGNRFPLLKILFCCGQRIFRGDLYDITELEIQRIDTKNDKFAVTYTKGDLSGSVDIKDLDFVIFKENEYYWFRCNSANSFMKWVTCIQIRRT